MWHQPNKRINLARSADTLRWTGSPRRLRAMRWADHSRGGLRR
jgi:hypothetical protein